MQYPSPFGIISPYALDEADASELIRYALKEDIGDGDITSILTIPEDAVIKADFVLRQASVMCGLPVLAEVFRQVDATIGWEQHVQEGEFIDAGSRLLTVQGRARGILAGERVALNIVQQLCGIASLAHQFSMKLEGLPVKLLDTRKTLPGLRGLSKYAVKIGGCENHRMRLDDMILIKDNHIAIAGGIAQAIALARQGNQRGLMLEVECDTLEQVKTALPLGVDWLLLDNMSIEELKQAVEMRQQLASKVQLEASGNMMLETVRAVAESGVDAISVGALTHSAKAIDIGLDIFSY